MAKESPKEVVEAPIVIPHGLELDPDCVPIASDENSVTVERGGKKWKVSASQHPAVDWEWIEVA